MRDLNKIMKPGCIMSSINKELPGHVNPKSNRKGSGQLGLCSGRILSGLMGSRIKTKGSGLVKPNAGSERPICTKLLKNGAGPKWEKSKTNRKKSSHATPYVKGLKPS